MSLPPLESTDFGTNTTNGTTSIINSITAEKKFQTPYHEHNKWIHQHYQQIHHSKKVKSHVPGEPDLDPSSSDSSSKKSNLSNDINSSKSNKKECNKKKKRHKHKKQELTGSPSSDSGSADNSDYRHKQ